MRRLLLILGLVVLLIGQAAAQRRVITGTILSPNGTPVIGATVIIKGTNSGTSTGNDGGFSISAAAGAKTLIVSAINFNTLELNIQGKTGLGPITLQVGNKILDEVVVVAYGVQKKTNLTGSVVTVSGNMVADKPFASPDKALQGAVAGMQVSSANGIPGSSTDIRIRGTGSIAAGTDPLWVIDGIISTTGDLTTNTTSANALSGLNPDDIESFSVLKDASATALYGSRAGNGVIIVTTKHGKSGKTRINFSTELGANSLAYSNKNNQPLTTPGYHQLLITSIVNGQGVSAAQADELITDPTNGLGLASNWASTNTNWLKDVTNTGGQMQYNLSLAGGDEKTQYYASAGYFDQLGTTISTYFKRYNGDLSITNHVNSKLTFGANINGSYSFQLSPPPSAAYSSPVAGAFFLPPYYTPYLPGGGLRYGSNDSLNEFPQGAQFNPLAVAKFDRYTDEQTEFRGGVNGSYQILPNLKITSRYSAEYLDINEYSYWNPLYGDGYPLGLGQAYDRKLFNWTWTNQADYHLNFNSNKDFYVDLLAGQEAYEQKDNYLQAVGSNFPSVTSLTYLASAAVYSLAYNLPKSNSVSSYFSQAVFNYKDRYILSGSFRRDGSSVFAAGHQWGNFYSVGASWNINEEKFMEPLPVFSLLKLRSSYGETGNTSGFGDYPALATYGYGSAYQGQAGSAPNNVGNNLLTWERNKPFNIGLDWGIWKDRLGGTVEYYKRTTSDLILNVPLSLTSGFATQTQNVGSMYNKGVELSLTGKPIVTRDFTWVSTFNFTHNTNRVTHLYNHVPILQTSGNQRFNITEGHDVYEFYTRGWAGADPANGNPLWYTDGTKKSTTNNSNDVNLALTGKSATPKYYGSFTNTFTYKGFSLEGQLYYNFGNYIYSTWENYLQSDGLYLPYFGQLSEQLKGWQKPGDKTNVPAVIIGGNMNSNIPSTRYLYKGDYIRLRDVQLSYSLPKANLDKMHINNATIYVRGTNLLTFGTDKNLAFDPEIGANSVSDFQVFMPKSITAGLRIGF
jgi:TonB-linked SusC/RagA family outer membrane protein